MNGQYGVVSTGGGQASFDRSNITGNPLDVLAQAASDVTLMSAVYGTTSPAINVTGNNNSIVNYAVV
jgi:hypothetical protein